MICYCTKMKLKSAFLYPNYTRLKGFRVEEILSGINLKKLADVSWSKNFPAFCGTGSSLSYSQGLPTVAIQRQMNLIHTRPSSFIKTILILHRSCELSASDVSIKTLLSPFSQASHVTCTLSAFGNCEKRLLASSCLHFCPAACNNSAPTRRIFMKFHI